MRLKKLLLQLSLLLTFVSVGSAVMVTSAHAAGSNPTGVDADATLLSGNSFNSQRDAANLVSGSSNGDYYGVQNYPNQSSGVYANGVKNGRITTATTKFFVHFALASNGNPMTIKEGYFTSVYPDVSYTSNGKAVSLVKNSVSSWTTGQQKSVTKIPSGWTELDVDLKDLGNTINLPLNIGFSYGYYEQYLASGTAMYYTVQLNSDPDVIKNMGDITIDGGGTVASSAHTVTGSAQPNLMVKLTGIDGDYTTQADSSGKFTFDLGTNTLKSLHAGSSITATEYNEFGDTKSASATVTNTVPLTITSSTPSLTISPDDWDAHIAGKSSTDIASWIASQTGMTATKPDGTTPSTLAFDTTDSDQLKATVTGGTQDVTMNVTDSDGNASTTPATISVTRGAGKLEFGDMTDMVFGNGASLAVPGQSTLYAPGDYQINISDTRELGSAWYVTANATTMTSTDSSHRPLSGHIVYEDGNGTKTRLDSGSAVSVASGKRDSNSTDIAKDWNQDGKSYSGNSAPAGVYLDANPNIYAAGNATSYSGTITWSLTDVPVN
ncbi:hypothetical protein [Levilactobacillus huananensis]|uniref:hypothetical protein n=1 Tax=Levilactobacillus huananensis TaxID=2486019 RepID=UPI000F789AFC|nr:hypothetical protein [Levilactobacillus huananensis]